MESFSQTMISDLYGNPHSASAPAQKSGEAVDEVRKRTLRFLGADPEDFDLVFVANATAAIKLVGESFRDLATTNSSTATFSYCYHRDSHTSLVGLRELTGGKHWCFLSDLQVEKWIESPLDEISSSGGDELPVLFAYPGQSNMTGRRLPLSWPGMLRNSPLQNAYTLLDAAALATTSCLKRVFSDPGKAPDFVTVSFYKIFGFPDLGALVVRKSSGHILTWRKYFGGGTIDMATVVDQTWHRNKIDLHEALEDGTLPFHSIIALGCALDVHKNLYGTMETISQHTQYLVHRLYQGLQSLKHSNGRPLCVIYSELGNEFNDSEVQGGTIAFNVTEPDGKCVPYSAVERTADAQDIYLRAGGLCNPGGIASYLNIRPWEFKRNWSAGHRCGSGNIDIINNKPTGVVRASLGAMSTIKDVDTLLTFLASAFIIPSIERITQSSLMNEGAQYGMSSQQLESSDSSSVSPHMSEMEIVPRGPTIPSSISAHLAKPPADPSPILAGAFRTRLLLLQAPNLKKRAMRGGGDGMDRVGHDPRVSVDSVHQTQAPGFSLTSDPTVSSKVQRRKVKMASPVNLQQEDPVKERRAHLFWGVKKVTL
jgi:molybdenum cofactor sulfurtransferase